MVELNGPWLAAPADEDLRRAYPAADFDDDGWQPVDMPGSWPSPMLLRHRFTLDASTDAVNGKRWWLRFDDVHGQADVWLDGGYVGDLEGPYVAHTFEVTDQVAAASEHVLAMEVTAATSLAAGVRRSISVHPTGPVAIRSLRVLCLEATAERALLSFAASVDAHEAVDASFLTTVGPGGRSSATSWHGTEHEEEQRLAAGVNRVEWRVAVEAPPLWWPHALGPSHLIDVAVSVRLDAGEGDGDGDRDGSESDRRALRTGIRQVRMRNWIASVNGERLFLKGATFDGECELLPMKEQGFDLLLVAGHVASPELYDEADHHGMLLWQDVPVAWGWARGVRRQSVTQATAIVDTLGHRPSIAAWCSPDGGGLQRAIEKADRSRPAVTVAAWEHEERDLARVAALWPSAVRFTTAADRRDAETLRRLKYRPTGGFLAGEPGPAIAPVIVVADQPDATYTPGEAIALDVHVVNDLRTPLTGMVVHARLSWPGGGHTWGWTGDAPADSCVLVGTVQAVAPDAEGPLTLELTLAGDGAKAENRYESDVRR